MKLQGSSCLALTAFSISAALFPEAQIKKTWPKRSSYRLFHAARSFSTKRSSSAEAVPGQLRGHVELLCLSRTQRLGFTCLQDASGGSRGPCLLASAHIRKAAVLLCEAFGVADARMCSESLKPTSDIYLQTGYKSRSGALNQKSILQELGLQAASRESS